MKKTIFSIVLLVTATFFASSASAQTTAIVSLTGPASPVVLGNTATVSVNVSNVANFGAYSFVVQFNPAVLQVVSNGATADNTFLSSTGNTANLLQNIVDNTAGTVSMASWTLGNNTGPNGAGRIATIVFNTLAQGTTQLQINTAIVSDVNGIQQSSTTQGTNVQIVPGLAASPSPSPSASASPLPSVSPSASPIASATPNPSVTPDPSPSTAPGNLTLEVAFQGVDTNTQTPPPGPNKNVTVTFRKNGAVVATDQGLVFIADGQNIYHNQAPIDVSSLTDNPYDVCVKGPSHLTRCFTGITLSGPDMTLRRTNRDPVFNEVLLGGNAHDNIPVEGAEKITIDDFGFFRADFLTSLPTTTPANYAADFDFNGFVDIFDYSYIAANFDKVGD
jgi:hypothetical protein